MFNKIFGEVSIREPLYVPYSAKNGNNDLMPIAIQLYQTPGENNPVSIYEIHMV